MGNKRILRLIVNADDLGYSEVVNHAIFDLMAQNKVTSATIMANGQGFIDAINKICYYSQCSIGVHLNLTEFHPLLEDGHIHVLLTENGVFAGNAVRSANLNSNLCNAIYREWCAQVGKVIDSGVKVSHLDGHHHVHTIPQLFLVLKRVQKRFDIKRVRISRNLFISRQGFYRRSVKAIYNILLRYILATSTTDGFTSFVDFYEIARKGCIPLHWHVIELMVHPGCPGFENENYFLENESFDLLPYRICPITYNDL